MKNLLFPKANRLLIQFKESKRKPERIESFRTTSTIKAQNIIDKRNKSNIKSAIYGMNEGFVKTDRNLALSKVKMY